MFLKFKKEDSIYRIFSTIQKIPAGKKVKIFIDCKNEFFSNIWWGRQLKDLMDKKKIDYIFFSNCKKANEYFSNLGIKFIYKKGIKDKLKKFLKIFLLYEIFRNPWVYKKYSFGIYILLFLELTLVGYIFYWFYNFVTHHAVIYITPAYKVETIVNNFFVYTGFKPRGNNKYYLPYYKKTISIQLQQTISVSNLKYITHPSQGQVAIYNFTDKDLSFKAGTKFITSDGLLFRSKYWFRLPPAKDGKPGIGYTTLVALDRDINGDIIGKRGNINSGTKLYILKYSPSYDLHKIYAIALSNFQGGETLGKGIVSKEDINRLKESLINTFKSKIPDRISKDLSSDSNKILLNFPQFISWKIKKIDIDAKPGQVRSLVNGILIANITYGFLKWSDIEKIFKKYLRERSLSTEKVVQIDKKSVILLDDYKVANNLFMVPIRVDVIKGYNFDLDKSGILDKIKLEIAGKTIKEAKNIILNYPQIDSVIIKVYPIWYNTLPKLKSEIKIRVIK